MNHLKLFEDWRSVRFVKTDNFSTFDDAFEYLQKLEFKISSNGIEFIVPPDDREKAEEAFTAIFKQYNIK